MRVDTDILPPEAARARSRPRAALGALAVAQHGAVSRRQLLALGFTRHEIEGMIRAGWLHRVHSGVYAVGRRSLGAKGRYMAAVLACGTGAVLGHRSAASHLGLWRSATALIEVTAASGRGRRPGIRTSVSGALAQRDRIVHEGIPCASVAPHAPAARRRRPTTGGRAGLP